MQEPSEPAEPVVRLSASEYAELISFLMDAIDAAADLLPSKQRAELKGSLRDSLLKSGGDPRAGLGILKDHLKKARELLREVRQ
jgi:hypothetical protein